MELTGIVSTDHEHDQKEALEANNFGCLLDVPYNQQQALRTSQHLEPHSFLVSNDRSIKQLAHVN